MIAGHVNRLREAIVTLSLYGAEASTQEIDAVIDTGYSGYLALPAPVIEALGLQRLGIGYLTLANGNEVVSELCVATILWDGHEREVEVDSLELEALVGMALMEAYNLKIQVMTGGEVAIEPFSLT